MSPPPFALSLSKGLHQSSQSRHPVINLLARYKAIFQAAWAHRAELVGPKCMADEAGFQPAASEVMHTRALLDSLSKK